MSNYYMGGHTIGISSANLDTVAAILQRVLANEHVIYIKTHNYHWNITGPLFQPLHAVFNSTKPWRRTLTQAQNGCVYSARRPSAH